MDYIRNIFEEIGKIGAISDILANLNNVDFSSMGELITRLQKFLEDNSAVEVLIDKYVHS